MNPGKVFEADIRSSVPDDVYYLRLRDPILEDGRGGYRFGDRCPFDMLLYLEPVLCCLELKSTGGTSISFDGANPMIKPHQLQGLREAATKGCRAGVLLNYRRTGGTYFVSIQAFDQWRSGTDRKSINEKDTRHIGKAVPSRLLRTRHRYDIDSLFDRGQVGLEVV